MLGHFDVKLKDLPPGIGDADLLALMQGGKATPELDRLLGNMRTRQRAFGKNLVNDNFAAFTFNRGSRAVSTSPIPTTSTAGARRSRRSCS